LTSLSAGTRLGAYDILTLIGSGGMGEVYRARDTKLNRDVALKVLPAGFAADPERLARLHREAQVLASLNHPHIAHIYGFEEANDTRALVLELVEGETLADRINRGPIPLPEALPIAKQIAEALEAAHEQGIIHRDLKPANIKVRDNGTVKVLDFGLAKAMDPPATSSPSVTQSPTITTPAMMTGVGVILGTAAYMSPEQAKGRPADKRSDIWAFGCVLFEMLTGRRAFAGDDVADTLAAVLRAEPEWTALPPEVPQPLRILLQRCLEKDRWNRVADASTIRFVIDVPAPSFAAPAARPDETAPERRWRWAAPAAAAAIVASVVTGMAVWMVRGAPAATHGLTRFPVALQETQSFGSNGLPLVAISPDGSQVAYATLSPAEPTRVTQRLYIRSMSETAVKPIAGTEAQGGAVGAPVFSPDNQSIVFYTGAGANGPGVYDQMKGALKRISVSGGTPVTLCNVQLPLGLSWSGDTIVFGQPSRGVFRVRASGGEPEQIVTIADGEIAQGPQMLPGGDAVLFTLARGISGRIGPTDDTWDKADIVVQSVKSATRKTLIQGGSDARYLPSGHLVYAVAGTLRAVAFDVRRLEVVGRPTLVLEGVGRARFGPQTRTGSAHFSVSESGSLVYLPGPASPTASLQNVAYIDRDGAIESLKLTPARYEFPRISPDGKQVAVGINDDTATNIWIYDLSRTSSIRQLTVGGKNRFPVWSADGQYVTFQSDREGDLAIFWQRADGSAPPVRLTRPEAGAQHVPDSWSPKNDQLLFDVETGSRFSLALLNVRDRKVAPFDSVQSVSNAPAAVFSADGRWVAYQSYEGSNARIFIQPVPPTGTAFPVANGRGPRFSPDGKQVYYTVADRLLAVVLKTEPTFSVSNPVVINQNPATGAVRGNRTSTSALPRNWDLTHDNRFIGIIDETPAATSFARHIEVVLDWFDELKQRVPLKQSR
jgi:Tol biopolymer transport system component